MLLEIVHVSNPYSGTDQMYQLRILSIVGVVHDVIICENRLVPVEDFLGYCNVFSFIGPIINQMLLGCHDN